MMTSFHLLLVAALIHAHLAEIYDVTTIYRFDKPHEIGNFSTSVVDLPSLTNWASSGWIETDSETTFAVLPMEERKILTADRNNGMRKSIPIDWQEPFVIKVPDRQDSEVYIIFMTSKEIQFGDLLVLHLSDSLSVKSCNFLEGGLSISSLHGRRCRNIGIPSVVDSRDAKDYYFHIHENMVVVTSSGIENENGMLVNIPSVYLLEKSYVSVGIVANKSMEFIFSIPKKVMGLSKPTGQLETEFSINSSSALCFEMTYLMQHYLGSNIKLFLESGSRRIILGEVNGKETEGKWSTHRFLTERLQSKHSYRLIIEGHNEHGELPIFIYDLENCVEKGHWKASTYPLPGTQEVHANTNAIGHKLHLHNGTVITPAPEERKLITPIPGKEYDGRLHNWDISNKTNEATIGSKYRLESASNVTLEDYEYSLAMEFGSSLILSFSVPYNTRELRIYLNNLNTRDKYMIVLDRYVLSTYSEADYDEEECDFGPLGRTYCESTCRSSRDTYWEPEDEFYVILKQTGSSISVTAMSEGYDTITCYISSDSLAERSEISYIISNRGPHTTFYLRNEVPYTLKLAAQEGTIASPSMSPINDQLCLGLTYYMEPNTTLRIYAEQDNGKKFEMSTIHAQKTTGWQHKIVKRNYGLFDKSVQYIIQGTGAENSSLLIQDAYACDSYENVFEIKQEGRLTVINNGADVNNINRVVNVRVSDHCLNGGVLTEFWKCACPPGFVGPRCEEGCGPNRFGDDCSGLCSASKEECSAMILCRPHLGCDCAPGYTGYFCLQNCSEYWFGAGCRQPCGHCRLGSCDPYTGHCRGGCTPGFYPPLCKEKCSYLRSAPAVEKANSTVLVTLNLDDRNMIGRGTPYYYQLQYKSAHGEWLPLRSDLIDSNKPRMTVSIDNLPLYEVYLIRAVIINKDGTSYQGDSVPVTEANLCFAPGAADYSLRSGDIKQDGFLLMWKVTPMTADWCLVDHYEVFIKKGWRWAPYSETTNNSVYVGALSLGQKYAVKVRAVTSTGKVANFSDPLEVRVSGWPLEVVKDLKVVSAEVRTLTVSWNYPEPEAEAIQHYVVSYECLGLISCPNHSCSISRGQKQTEEKNVTLTGLIPHAQYLITVAPFKDTQGPITDLLAITLPAGSQVTPGVPEDIVFDLTNSSFSIRWTMPENCSELNGFFRGFHYRIRARGEHDVLADGDTIQTTVTFSDLAPLTYYDVEVFVMTNGGWDEKYPLSIPVQTKATTPDKVTDLTVYKRARRMLGLRWGRPVQTYGTLKFFTVTYSETRNPFKTRTLQVEPIPCTAWPHLYCCTITHVNPNMQYVIRVQARNSEVDEDGDVVEIKAIPNEGAPSAPSYIQLISRSDSSLLVRWGIPHMLNGILRSFLVSVEEVDTYNISDCCQYLPMQELPVQAEENSYQLEVFGLRPASTYTVSVSAKTVALGPPVVISAQTRPPSPHLAAAPNITLDEVEEEVMVVVEPVTDMQDLVRGYLLLLIPSLSDKEISEAVIWDDVFAEELRASVKETFYLVAELMQDELMENKVHVLRWNQSSEDGVFGQIVSPEPSGGVTYRLGLVAVLEYQGVRSFAYKESEPFVLPWLGSNS